MGRIKLHVCVAKGLSLKEMYIWVSCGCLVLVLLLVLVLIHSMRLVLKTIVLMIPDTRCTHCTQYNLYVCTHIVLSLQHTSVCTPTYVLMCVYSYICM